MPATDSMALRSGVGNRLKYPNRIDRAHFEQKARLRLVRNYQRKRQCWGSPALAILDQICEQYRSCSTAWPCMVGTLPIKSHHLKALKEMVKLTKTPFLSDHLCLGSVDGTYTHDLLPMQLHLRPAAKRRR